MKNYTTNPPTTKKAPSPPKALNPCKNCDLGLKRNDCSDYEFAECIEQNVQGRWNKDVVYKVYCNDDLKTLPILILEDMRDYIQEIIDEKNKKDRG